jgi:hypothetical protein
MHRYQVASLFTKRFTSSEEDSSMAIETSATQQSRRPRHNPENNNPKSQSRYVIFDSEKIFVNIGLDQKLILMPQQKTIILRT